MMLRKVFFAVMAFAIFVGCASVELAREYEAVTDDEMIEIVVMEEACPFVPQVWRRAHGQPQRHEEGHFSGQWADMFHQSLQLRARRWFDIDGTGLLIVHDPIRVNDHLGRELGIITSISFQPTRTYIRSTSFDIERQDGQFRVRRSVINLEDAVEWEQWRACYFEDASFDLGTTRMLWVHDPYLNTRTSFQRVWGAQPLFRF